MAASYPEGLHIDEDGFGLHMNTALAARIFADADKRTRGTDQSRVEMVTEVFQRAAPHNTPEWISGRPL